MILSTSDLVQFPGEILQCQTPAEGKKPLVLIIQSPIQFIYGIVSGPKL